MVTMTTDEDDNTEYELLRDAVIEHLNPPDDDAAEVSILIDAIEQAASYIESQPCTCTPEQIDEYGEACARCTALGRVGDERAER